MPLRILPILTVPLRILPILTMPLRTLLAPCLAILINGLTPLLAKHTSVAAPAKSGPCLCKFP